MPVPSDHVRLTVLGPLAAVRAAAAGSMFCNSRWSPKQVCPDDYPSYGPGCNEGEYLPMAFPQGADPVITPDGATVRAWWEGYLREPEWQGDVAHSAAHPKVLITAIRGARGGDQLSIRTSKAGKVLHEDTFEGDNMHTVLLYLPESDALHFPLGSRSVRAGQLGWVMRGHYAHCLAAPLFTVLSHAPDTAASRGAFERMVNRVSGAPNARQMPGELLELVPPRTSGRIATFALPLDTRIHLGAQRGHAQSRMIDMMTDFIWHLANLDADANTLFRYAAEIAGTPHGTSALLDVLPHLAGATGEEMDAVDHAFFRAEDVYEDDGSVTPADPALLELPNTRGLVELALRMAWLRGGQRGPMPTVSDHARATPAAATGRSTSPTVSTWDALTTLLADHLNAAAVGDPGPIHNITAEGSGTRYVQFSCTRGEGMLAEVVSPEYIDAGPDFFTWNKVTRLEELGFAPGAFGELNHGRTYEHTQWQDAAVDAVTILREVLEVDLVDVTIRQN